MSKREFQFYKYQGCGNDFILFDNRNGDIELDTETIEKWCNRRFGIGADGLMLLGLSNTKDFFTNAWVIVFYHLNNLFHDFSLLYTSSIKIIYS